MSKSKPLLMCVATILFTLVALPAVSAQVSVVAGSPATDSSARLTKLEQQAAAAKSSADNAWMLTSSALVLMMTGPGLALFYSGLVRKKNVLGTMMQSFALMAVVTVLWALFSYSLSFGPGNGFIGGFQNVFLRGVGASPDADYAKFGYDDSLDALGVHGAGVTLGAILTGVFAVSAVNPIFKDWQGNVLPSGLQEGNAHQLLNQLVGIAISWVLAIVGTLVILKLVDGTIGLRVSEEEEEQGLDLSQHGEEGYYWETPA